MGDIREFTIQHENQKVNFKVTGSSIKFGIKGRVGAYLELTKKPGSYRDFLIVIEDEQYSLLHRSELITSGRLQNNLSDHEFKMFWLSWNSNNVKLGELGCKIPVLEYNCMPNINYVKFCGSNVGVDIPIHWKVELPPVSEAPMFKALPGGELHWVPMNADTKVLPKNAFIGGFEKEILYIIRAKHRESLTPGKYVPSENAAYIAWGGAMHNKETYEMLCGYDCTWVRTYRDVIPYGAVVAGYSEDIGHEKLYIGRVKRLGHYLPGKVQPSHRVCYVPFNNREYGVSIYEILVAYQPDKYANTVSISDREYYEDEIDTEYVEDIWFGDEHNVLPY